jgi:hypothetical protein
MRGELTTRAVVALRGTPDALGAMLWPQALARGADRRRVVVLGDGAPWTWNLAETLLVDRVEILDWYHADEHISAVARLRYGGARTRRSRGGRRSSIGWRRIRSTR